MPKPYLPVMLCIAIALLFLAAFPAAAQDDDAWIGAIRPNHPRMFFNADTFPAVKQRALTDANEFYKNIWTEPDYLPRDKDTGQMLLGDWGRQLMRSAFVYCVEPDPTRLENIKTMMRVSLQYYQTKYDENMMVDWYSTSRIGWLCALDWTWNDLTPEERTELATTFLDRLDDGLHKKLIRVNRSGYSTGYYGENNLQWFTGLVLLNEGIDDARALDHLRVGYREYQKLRTHRAAAVGDDGGAASPTLTYSFHAYPWCEFNFLYTWESATGEKLAPRWPHIASMSNYVLWSLLPGNLEFGYGDVEHKTNRFPASELYPHMSNTMHLYAESHPDLAALAAYVREQLGGDYNTTNFPIHAFLQTNLPNSPPPLDPGALPPARHFDTMGQVLMRSGSGPDDTYCLFACGGILGQHRHFDATHFTIYHKGFLALDTGTRTGNTDNLQNYYAQTVAHNCILIKMPGEPPIPYWNGTVFGNDGGQYKALGSKVIAFETSPEFTYVAGDATATYRPEKCSQIVRQLVFIPPHHFVVFDRVISTDAAYTKRWLLHHANEPVMDGNTWHSDQDRGRIFCRTLLPAEAIVEPIGGPGKEFLADGVNYAIDAGPSEQTGKSIPSLKPIHYDEVPELMGRWRVEVSPRAARTDDVFLHLIQVGDQTLERMDDATVTQTADTAALTFTHEGKTVTLSFNTTGGIGGTIRIETAGGATIDRPLTQDVMHQEGLATTN